MTLWRKTTLDVRIVQGSVLRGHSYLYKYNKIKLSTVSDLKLGLQSKSLDKRISHMVKPLEA